MTARTIANSRLIDGAKLDNITVTSPIDLDSVPTAADLLLKEDKANKGVANGYAPLDATGKVPVANLPASGIGDVAGPASSTDNAIARFDGITGKLVQNSTVTLSDSGNLAGLNELHFSLSPTPSAYAEGTLRWNTTDKCLDIEVGNGSTLQVGQEIFVRVRNATGSTIANGALCYINGATGSRPTVALAKADAEATSHTLIGMSTDNIADNADGFITVLGTVNDLDTSSFADGAELFLSATTAGAFVTTAPSAPNYVVKVGTVSRSHGVNGKILVQTSVHTVSASDVRGQLPATQVSFDPTGTTLSATEVQSALVELAAEKIQEPTNAYATGYVLTWNGTDWVGQENTPAVGSASKFYLDATATLADNLALSISPSTFPETTISVSADAGIGGGVSFLERFVSGPLGRTIIPAGNWDFSTFGSVSAVTGTNFIHTRINRRSELTGMTATFTGTGTTRTLTVTGGTPFVAGDANASVLAATLVETPNQTCWISGFTSSSVVTVTLTDAGYVNETNTPLSALYYRLFLASSNDIAATGIQEFSYSTTQPEFTGLNPTDRIVAAYFAQTDSGTARTFTLYYGGTARFSSFESPIKTLHSDLMGLDWASSGHTGTASTIAGFSGAGVAESVTVGSGLSLSGGVLSSSGGAAKQIRIRIPGELVADTSNYQGVFWKNDTGATITISNVGFYVALAAQGTGAAAAFNVYKSSGTDTDGINTSAVNLFTSAVDLGTSYSSATNAPNTATVEAGRWVSLRCTSSAGATRKASDAEAIITYS